MNRRNPMRQLTHDDKKQITELAIIGYSEAQATKAYIDSGKDLNRAAMILLHNRTFDKRFLYSFEDLMFSGRYIGHDIFGFSSKIDVACNKFRTYILEQSLQEIITKDKIKVAKLTNKDNSKEEAAKDFLILEKKRPIEVDKLDIKACFQQ